MPITWTAETDAKLFLGFLAQCRSENFKPDYEKLAAHMGPEVTACAIQNRIIRLRRMVEDKAGSESAPTTPAKRKPGRPPKSATPTPKKVKEEGHGVEVQIVKKEKMDEKRGAKKEEDVFFDMGKI
ncbi:hypothetical protein BDV25DRAFT_135778 [Aspergillus avenaceus]|uniref:AT hook motif protein n=1 Tax=Aspergillus avenaceus TaxID=36643 RepID=A0A5N6U7R8_ASPAV|nr:hypothetical protein BDV25DRAFT_135778 [Aspergillus avenaceus]